MSKIIFLVSESEFKPSSTGKGGYTLLKVSFKDENGKLKSRNVMSFVNKPVYDALSKAKPGESFEVTEAPNAKGYDEFITVKSLGVLAETPAEVKTVAGASKVVNSTYASAEERAATQRLIVRQSSITAAINLFPLSGKTKAATVDDILFTAKKFEQYVFGEDNASKAMSAEAAILAMQDSDLDAIT